MTRSILMPSPPGSAVLRKLFHCGGTGAIDELMLSVPAYFRSEKRFMRMVATPLAKLQFARVLGQRIVLTPKGRDWVAGQYGEAQDAPSERYRAPVRPLNLEKHMRMPVTRPGAFDYRNFPSLVGGERVPFAVGRLAGKGDGES